MDPKFIRFGEGHHQLYANNVRLVVFYNMK